MLYFRGLTCSFSRHPTEVRPRDSLEKISCDMLRGNDSPFVSQNSFACGVSASLRLPGLPLNFNANRIVRPIGDRYISTCSFSLKNFFHRSRWLNNSQIDFTNFSQNKTEREHIEISPRWVWVADRMSRSWRLTSLMLILRWHWSTNEIIRQKFRSCLYLLQCLGMRDSRAQFRDRAAERVDFTHFHPNINKDFSRPYSTYGGRRKSY